MRWGTDGLKERELPRPKFEGYRRRSPVTGEEELYYPTHYRAVKQLVSAVCLLLLFTVGFAISFRISVLRDHWAEVNFRWGDKIGGMMSSCRIMIFNFIGRLLALRLNQWENYRTQTAFTNAFVVKVYVYSFCNSFEPFFFIAFIKGMTKRRCVRDDCLSELQNQLVVIFIVMAAMNIVEVGLPFLLMSWRRRNVRYSPLEQSASLDDIVERVVRKEEYGSSDVDGTFDDYSEITIQFSFVMLFAAAFPLAPVFGIMLNALETKTDGLKLYQIVRRPMPQDADDIGTWFNMLQFMTIISVFTNAALLVWTFKCTDSAYQWGVSRITSDELYFVIFSASLSMMKYWLSKALPKTSVEVMQAQQRLQNVKDRAYMVDVRIPKEAVSIRVLSLEVQSPGQIHCDPNNYGTLGRGSHSGLFQDAAASMRSLLDTLSEVREYP